MSTLLRDACLLVAIAIACFTPTSGHRPAQTKSSRVPPAWGLSTDVRGLNRTESQRFPRVSSQRIHLDSASAVQKGVFKKDDEDSTDGGHNEAVPYDKRAWLMVGLSASCAGVAVILTAKIGECLAAPSKRVPTETDKIEEELEEAKARAETLTQALKEHLEAQRAQQEEGEQLPGADETTAVALDALNSQELLGGMHFRTKFFQKSLDLTVDDLQTQTASLMAKGARIQEVVLQEAGAFRERAAKYARKEAEELIAKMRKEFAEDMPNLPSVDPNALDDLGFNSEARKQVAESIPAFGLLIAGTFAPAQLQSIQGNASFNIMLNGFLCATAVGLAAATWNTYCKDRMVWIWLHGVIGVSLVLVLSNSATQARASAALQVLKDARGENKPNTGNSVWDTYFAIKNSGPFLLKALFVYDNLTMSCIYSLNQIAGLIYLIWGGVGVYVSIANILMDLQECDARGVVAFMHFVSFMYVLLFTWSLISLVIWFVVMLSSSSAVGAAILKAAMKMDDEQDHGIPICVTVVKSFVLRSSVDMIQVQKTALAQEIQKLEEDAKECETVLEKRRAAMSELEAQERTGVEEEDALIAKYTAQVHATLEAAKPLITIAAISQQGGFENANAAMAALNERAQAVAEDLGQQAQGMAEVDWHGQAMATMDNLRQQADEAAEGLQQQLDEHAPMFAQAQEQAAAATLRLQQDAAPVLAAAQEQATATAQRLQQDAVPALAAAQEKVAVAAGTLPQQAITQAPSAAAAIGTGGGNAPVAAASAQQGEAAGGGSGQLEKAAGAAGIPQQ